MTPTLTTSAGVPGSGDFVFFLREETRPWWRRIGPPPYGSGPDVITTANPEGFQVGMEVDYLGRHLRIVHMQWVGLR